LPPSRLVLFHFCGSLILIFETRPHSRKRTLFFGSSFSIHPSPYFPLFHSFYLLAFYLLRILRLLLTCIVLRQVCETSFHILNRLNDMNYQLHKSLTFSEKPKTSPTAPYDPLDPEEPDPGSLPLPPDSNPEPPAPVREPERPVPITDPPSPEPTRL
jgi:hypothetical protein